ncbi:MAG: Root adhesin [Candidatus Accumulibacter sp. BA-94]|jgi:outer membrane protein OmpA-like peptidoglycan-associated protein|uniref:OmpA family protein n=1 Tax=Accumulibacter sp. TaxID=2053492 RepID=UPI000451B4CF|nr:OmpA family protein [Accumulibacter sp.]EXI91799.1 MAG: Root adhesin [Candidatus Accumulibacter sp. BA-94]MBL8390369.1 OmpA family protein [Accumulibacter sp.]HRD86722.1 OmpA family protein [Accumulibacter sp.]
MIRVRIGHCVLWLTLAACSRVTDHVLLLPGPDGRVGALSVAAAGGEIVLAEPYSGVDVRGGRPSRLTSSPRMVRESYGRLLDMQPARPRIYVVHFETGTTVLTPESRSKLPIIRDELASLPAAEAIVIGHTDRTGSSEGNDRLSLRRAEAVREQLIRAGVAPDSIAVVGRGEREPVVLTEDGVAEPRNRRVEIKLR